MFSSRYSRFCRWPPVRSGPILPPWPKRVWQVAHALTNSPRPCDRSAAARARSASSRPLRRSICARFAAGIARGAGQSSAHALPHALVGEREHLADLEGGDLVAVDRPRGDGVEQQPGRGRPGAERHDGLGAGRRASGRGTGRSGAWRSRGRRTRPGRGRRRRRGRGRSTRPRRSGTAFGSRASTSTRIASRRAVEVGASTTRSAARRRSPGRRRRRRTARGRAAARPRRRSTPAPSRPPPTTPAPGPSASRCRASAIPVRIIRVRSGESTRPASVDQRVDRRRARAPGSRSAGGRSSGASSGIPARPGEPDGPRRVVGHGRLDPVPDHQRQHRVVGDTPNARRAPRPAPSGRPGASSGGPRPGTGAPGPSARRGPSRSNAFTASGVGVLPSASSRTAQDADVLVVVARAAR